MNFKFFIFIVSITTIISGHKYDEGGYRNHFSNGFGRHGDIMYHDNRWTFSDFLWSRQDRYYDRIFKKKHPLNMIKFNAAQAINKTESKVNLILNSLFLNGLDQDNSKYLWDVLDPVYRIALLNQTGVKSLGFDVISVLSKNISALKWNSLSYDVQTFVYNQRESVLNLTFSDWSWCSPDNKLANTTLFSFLSKNIIDTLPSLINILNQIAFDTNIDLTTLENNLLNEYPLTYDDPNGQYLIQTFFDSFWQIYSSWLSNYKGSRLQAAYKIYTNAVNKLNRFYKSLYLSI